MNTITLHEYHYSSDITNIVTHIENDVAGLLPKALFCAYCDQRNGTQQFPLTTFYSVRLFYALITN